MPKDNKINQTVDNEYEVQSCYTFSDSDVSTALFGFNIFERYTVEDLKHIINNPMTYNYLLRKISNQMYNSCGLLTQCIDYCTSMVNLYYVVTPTGKSNFKKQKNKQLFESTLKKMHHKEIVRDALFKSMIDGVAFYYCEFTKALPDNTKYLNDDQVQPINEINDLGLNISAIPLPTNYTKIVGRKNSSYVLAFNLEYFDNLDSSVKERKLRMYPAEIRKEYNAYRKRGSGNWLILDNTKTVVSKIRSRLEEPWGRPLCLAAIKDILYDDYFKTTCRGVLDETNNRIIYQTLPPGQNNAVSSLTKQQQQAQHNAVKTAVMNKNTRNGTSFFTVAAGTKIDQITTDKTDILDEDKSSYIKDQIGIDLGFMANLLSGSASGNYSAQQNNLQLLISEIIMWLEPITEEIIKVVNANVIKNADYYVGLYYLPTSTITRTEFTSNMKDLYMNGKGSLQAWIASTGVDVSAYMALMDYELEEDYENKYPVHKTAYTMSSKDTSGGGNSSEEAGRPSDDDSLNENTIISKTNGSNDMPSPSDE